MLTIMKTFGNFTRRKYSGIQLSFYSDAYKLNDIDHYFLNMIKMLFFLMEFLLPIVTAFIYVIGIYCICLQNIMMELKEISLLASRIF